jgi:lysozyme
MKAFLRNISAPFRGLFLNLINHDPYSKPVKNSDSQAREINARGVELIKHFEGLYLTAYRCPAGVWTIGYGHTGIEHQDGTVRPGRKITKEEAEELLRHDMREFGTRVAPLVKVPLNDDQFSALVSFAFNVGMSAFTGSTLRKKLNAGDYAGAAAEFAKWTKAAGKTLSGLVRRRASERNLFLGHSNFIERA